MTDRGFPKPASQSTEKIGSIESQSKSVRIDNQGTGRAQSDLSSMNLPNPIQRQASKNTSKSRKAKKGANQRASRGSQEGASLAAKSSSPHPARRNENRREQAVDEEEELTEKEKFLIEQEAIRLAEKEKAEQERREAIAKKLRKEKQALDEKKLEDEMSEAISEYERSFGSSMHVYTNKSPDLKPFDKQRLSRQSHIEANRNTTVVESRRHYKANSDELIATKNDMHNTALSQDKRTVVEHADVYSNDFLTKEVAGSSSDQTLSGLRKSNPYEMLNRGVSPFDPDNEADKERIMERKLAMKAMGIESAPADTWSMRQKEVVGAVAPMRFNFKTENEVKRTLNYEKVFEDSEQIDFKQIDQSLKNDYLETKLRDIIVEHVHPIITLSKKNLLYNAHKNQMIEELKELSEQVCSSMDQLRNEVMSLQSLRVLIKQNHDIFNQHVVVCTTQASGLRQEFEAISQRVDDHESRLREMREYISFRDKKVAALIEQVNKIKTDHAKASIKTSKKFAQELKSRDQDILACNRLIRTMDSIINGQRSHLDNLSTQVMRFQIHLDLQDSRLEKINNTDLSELHSRLDDIMAECRRQTCWYAESNMKFDQSLARLEPLHERMRTLEQFAQRSVPLLTHLQISDALQEFLCLHDQLKLIEYDNKKLEQFSQSLLEELPADGDEATASDDSDEFPSTLHVEAQKKREERLPANIAKTNHEVGLNQMLHARLQALMTMMAEKKQGCIRFQWGRDWNIRQYSTVEEASSLKGVPYNMYLDNKKNLFKSMIQKDIQLSMMDELVEKAQQNRLRLQESRKSSVDSVQVHGVPMIDGPEANILDRVKSDGEITAREISLSQSASGERSEIVKNDGQLSEPDLLLDYYAPKTDCGFSGGTQTQTVLGSAFNAHSQGSGMNKVFREVTIIRTAGGGTGAKAKNNKIMRNQQVNRRKGSILQLNRLRELKKRLAKTENMLAEPIIEQDSRSDSDSSRSSGGSSSKETSLNRGSTPRDQIIESADIQQQASSEAIANQSDKRGDDPLNRTTGSVKKMIGSQQEHSKTSSASGSQKSLKNKRNNEKSFDSSSFRRQSTMRQPMLPSDMALAFQQSLAKLQSELAVHKNEFEMYKVTVVKQTGDLKQHLQSIDSNAKQNAALLAKLTQRQEKTRFKVDEVEQHLSSRIDQSEEYQTRSLKDMRRIYEEMDSDSKVFKKYIVDEYIEFFKSKKRIRQEWATHTAEIESKVEQYMCSLTKYDQNIESLNEVLPVLVELACLVSKFMQEDILVRNKLSQSLRLNQMANSGYLRTDASYVAMQQRQTATNGLPNDNASKQRISSLLAAQTQKDKPLSEQIVNGGALCASSVAYRNVTLSVSEYLQVLHYLVSLCRNRFSGEEKLKNPKKYFDDAIVQLRIQKRLQGASVDDALFEMPADLNPPASLMTNIRVPQASQSIKSDSQPLVRLTSAHTNLARREIGAEKSELLQVPYLSTGLPRQITVPLKPQAAERDQSPLLSTLTLTKSKEDIREESNERIQKALEKSRPHSIYKKSQKLLDLVTKKSTNSPGLKNKTLINNPVIQAKNTDLQRQYSSNTQLVRPRSSFRLPQSTGAGGAANAYMVSQPNEDLQPDSQRLQAIYSADSFSRQVSDRKFRDLDRFVGLDTVMVEGHNFQRLRQSRNASSVISSSDSRPNFGASMSKEQKLSLNQAQIKSAASGFLRPSSKIQSGQSDQNLSMKKGASTQMIDVRVDEEGSSFGRSQ